MKLRVSALVASFALVACGGKAANQEQRHFLVVIASATSPGLIAEKARSLAAVDEGLLVVQTSDCGERRSVFALVTELGTSAASVQPALQKARLLAPDAFVKICDVQPGSLLAVRISAVDRSIADVPKDAVNWDDEDRISIAKPLPDGRVLVVVKHFVQLADDPLEGRRQRVVLVGPENRKSVLEEQCVNAGEFALSQGRIALSCAEQQAGEFLLHSVSVFDSAGKRLNKIRRCRSPKWELANELTCQAESVDSNGKLVLVKTPIPLR